MPELPEVETIKNSLTPLLLREKIKEVKILSKHCLISKSLSFPQDLLNEEILELKRRGKLLYFVLTTNKILAFHLKMTGKILVAKPKESPPKHTHFLLLTEKITLFFEDVRKFGRIYLFTKKEFKNWSFIKTLGPEPLEIKEENFILLFQNSKAKIKSLLLNQKVIAGIGNIYADESLFAARIHPQSIACKIPLNKLKELHISLRQVLTKAIKLGGSSFRDYVNGLGQKGNFQKEFQVYGQAGNACPNCKNKLKKIKISGRSTVFCSSCQKKYE